MLRRAVVEASTRCRRFFVPSRSVSHEDYWFRKCSTSSPSSTHLEISENNFVEHLEDSTSRPAAKISIDRSGLYNQPGHSHVPVSDSELVKHLKGIIKFRGGPITVAEYMEEVLTNPKAGFYIHRDVFGTQGDFITSPEVSQMFGEMIGVWAMCLWEQMGRPEKVNFVELGPGRGTLLADLLRGASKIKDFTESLHVHLVECSPALKKIQYQNLKCEGEADENADNQIISSLAGTPISWHATLEQVPTGCKILHRGSLTLLCVLEEYMCNQLDDHSFHAYVFP